MKQKKKPEKPALSDTTRSGKHVRSSPTSQHVVKEANLISALNVRLT